MFAASVVSVPKKVSDSTQPSSHRPISLLPIASKIFKALINRRIVYFPEFFGCCLIHNTAFDTHVSQAIFVHQWGCKPNPWRARWDSYSRFWHLGTFDKIWYQSRLQKLTSYGIVGHVHKLLASFLDGRRISVVLNGHWSSSKYVNARYP